MVLPLERPDPQRAGMGILHTRKIKGQQNTYRWVSLYDLHWHQLDFILYWPWKGADPHRTSVETRHWNNQRAPTCVHVNRCIWSALLSGRLYMILSQEKTEGRHNDGTCASIKNSWQENIIGYQCTWACESNQSRIKRRILEGLWDIKSIENEAIYTLIISAMK